MNEKATRLFNAGDRLPDEPNCLWLITSGIVKSYTIDRQNRTVILGYWGAQEVVGRSLSKIEPYFLQCTNDVTVEAIAPENWDSLSDRLLDRIRQIQELSYIIRNPQQSDRLWLLLQWLVKKFGKQTSAGKLLDLKITPQELGEVLGLEEMTVSQILSQFQDRGAIAQLAEENILIKK